METKGLIVSLSPDGIRIPCTKVLEIETKRCAPTTSEKEREFKVRSGKYNGHAIPDLKSETKYRTKQRGEEKEKEEEEKRLTIGKSKAHRDFLYTLKCYNRLRACESCIL